LLSEDDPPPEKDAAKLPEDMLMTLDDKRQPLEIPRKEKTVNLCSSDNDRHLSTKRRMMLAPEQEMSEKVPQAFESHPEL
jgi:hypothetical protein